MMIVSFAWTTPALFAEDLALRKTEWRNSTKERYVVGFELVKLHNHAVV